MERRARCISRKTASSTSRPIRNATARSSPSRTPMIASGEDVMRELSRATRARDQRVARPSPQHSSRHAPIRTPTVANAFGDRYVYNLCPSAPEARAYAIGLARDVTESYPVAGVSLETPGLPAVRARIPSRVRAQSAKPLARLSAWPLLLRALHRGRKKRRDRDRSAAAAGRLRHRSLSRERRRLSRRHGRSVLACRRPQRRGARGAISIGAATSSPRWSAKFARPCGEARRLRSSPRSPARRRRLVRGKRPQGARGSRRDHRGLFLRTGRARGSRRTSSTSSGVCVARAVCAASCARPFPTLKRRASSWRRSARSAPAACARSPSTIGAT